MHRSLLAKLLPKWFLSLSSASDRTVKNSLTVAAKGTMLSEKYAENIHLL